jgi:tRNA splicing ligase
MESKRKEYKTVQLPKESTIMLDKIIEVSPEFAYRSHAELVMDLIRRRYEELVIRKIHP